MTGPNYLIGHGERLTEPVPPPRRQFRPALVYTPEQARQRLTPMIRQLSVAAAALPAGACPRDRAVAAITLHPQYIARSYHPDRLLQRLDARVVGSRPVPVTPEKWARKTIPQGGIATSSMLYVATHRSVLAEWPDRIQEVEDSALDDLCRVEEVHLPAVAEKRQTSSDGAVSDVYEVVLHTATEAPDRFVTRGFGQWCGQLGVRIDWRRSISTRGLTFIPLEAADDLLDDLAEYCFLRVIRPMPRLRIPDPGITRGLRSGATVELPETDPVDPSTRVVVFDGGLPDDSGLLRWCNSYNANGVGPAIPEFTEHGHMVTSAALFGSLHEPPQQPFAGVDHFRVLDAESEKDPYELYDVLRRIVDVLDRDKPEFVNLSIGPRLPVEDDEVHAWTAVLDEYMAESSALIAVAVGNDGNLDRQSGNARIQVPADSVNALAVGASSDPAACRRAPYSSLGPGRSPGVIKPDVLAFGGGEEHPFLVSDPANPGRLRLEEGTSFAAPAALRTAVGIRSFFGPTLNALTLKALLVHCAIRNIDDNPDEVGWGAIPALTNIITSSDDTARVIYQGTIIPASYLRAQIPLPHGVLTGLITVTATLTFACEVDPQDPATYTRSGIEVVFRPHSERYANDAATNPTTRSFFGAPSTSSELDLRTSGHKWETVLHDSHRFQPRTLHNPTFDIHYLARQGGTSYPGAPEMRYSLVITLRAPRVPDLYNKVLQTYPTQLQALNPVRIPIPIS